MKNFLYKLRFLWLAFMTSYFYKDHTMSVPSGIVLLDEDFYGNRFHRDWQPPSWERQSWFDWSKEKIIYKDSQREICDNTLILATEKNDVPEEPSIKSGHITSTDFLNRIYGFYECCMKPGGQWDAFWLWFSDKQSIGIERFEIDIMEMECDTLTAFTITIHSWGFDGKTNKILKSKRFQLKKSLTENYHVWGCDWQKEYIDFYLDDIKLWRYTGKIPNSDCFVWVDNSYKGGELPVYNYTKQIRVQKNKIL